MKKYNVPVNGTSYEITLEVVDEKDINKSASSAPASAPAAAPTASAAPSKGETVSSPMPGTILSVNVQIGTSVKKGDVLMVLEAMKMENEITAPCDGTVASLGVSKGAAVETGATLCVIA